MREAMIEKDLWAGFKELEVSSALSSSSVRQINTLYGEEGKAVLWKNDYT